MTTTGKIIIGLFVAAIAGITWYYWPGTRSAQPEESAQLAAPQSEKKMAFSEFMKGTTESYKCTVKQSVGVVATTGTVYIADKMIRGEFANTFQGQNIDVDFVVRDGYSYTWTSMMPTSGFKVKVDTATSGTPTGATAGSYSWNADQIGDYDCESWTADASMFMVPTNIKFQAVN